MSGAESDGLLTPEEEEELPGAAAKIALQHSKIINPLAASR
jgi:hypothetical protein